MSKYTQPELRARLKRQIMQEAVAGTAVGQWSARKAQLLKQRYEAAGGGYVGAKSKAQADLTKWTAEKWRTKSGRPSSMTGERYLPSATIASMSPAEYARTTAKKRKDTAAGKQYSRQPR